jgi:hypothetical protein
VGPSELNQLPRGPFGIVLHRSGLIGALVGHPPRIRPAGCPVRCRFGALTQPVITGGGAVIARGRWLLSCSGHRLAVYRRLSLGAVGLQVCSQGPFRGAGQFWIYRPTCAEPV